MQKSLLLSSLFVVTTLAAQAAQAEVKVRAGVASSTYELGGDYVSAESKYQPTMLGATYAFDNGMYIDLAYSEGSDKHDGWAIANAPTTICGGGPCGNTASPSEDFERTDLALIFGASKLNPNNGIAMTFYAGLKTGETTLGAQNASLPWTEETFTTTGVVFGGGASFPIASGTAGSVGVNLGLGLMGANWEDTTGYDVDADTAFGFSLGASYTYPFTSKFGIVADVKYNKYSYDFGDPTDPFTVDEDISAMGVSLYAKF